ncbi:hypothetical protein [Armatimonas sp.]|uniref:hypothetical protein n=1 Tax=Armatimonas sp. TaxID=1872638 RepID=UPI0037518F50
MTVRTLVVALASICLVGSISAFSIERAHAAIEGKTVSNGTMVYGTGYACKLTVCGPNSDPADIVGCNSIDFEGQQAREVKSFNPGKGCAFDLTVNDCAGPNGGSSKWCTRIRRYYHYCNTSVGSLIYDSWAPNDLNKHMLNMCSGGTNPEP